MTMPALPASGSTAWYPYASAVHDRVSSLPINVKTYGAIGDGTTDDTAAFQAAVNAAAATGGTLVLPDPTTNYKITGTIVVQPQGAATQTRMNIEGSGLPGAIHWAGAANTAVFQVRGLKRSTIRGVHVDVSSAAGVIAWDVDTTATFGSTSVVTWDNCFVDLGAAASIGWRLGHVSGGVGDISFLEWNNCSVNGLVGGTPTTGSQGWLNEGSNTLNQNWFGGYAQALDKAVTNQGATTGNDSMFFYGFGTSHNLTDFEFAAPGAYLISGGRFEQGKRFLNVTTASNHAAVTVSGVNLSAYTPADGILVNFDRPGTLIWDANHVKNPSGSNYTASAFTLGGFTGQGTFHARGGAIQAADPFWTLTGTWQVWAEGVGILNTSQQATGKIATRLGDVVAGGDPNPLDAFIPSNLAWYVNPLTHDVRTLVPTLNQLVLHVFHSGPDGVTIDKLDANVTTVGTTGAVLRAGVYQLSDQSRPFKSSSSPWGTLLLDAGTVGTASGTGQKLWTLGTALVIPANKWFAVGGVDQVATAATRTVGGVAGTTFGTKVGLTSGGSGGYGIGSPAISFFVTGITGALPSTVSSPGTLSVDSGIGIHRSV